MKSRLMKPVAKEIRVPVPAAREKTKVVARKGRRIGPFSPVA
jgi:hypothetical protein